MRFDEVRGVLAKLFQKRLEAHRSWIEANGRLSPVDRQTLAYSAGFAEQALEGGGDIWGDLVGQETDAETVRKIAAKEGVELSADTKELAMWRTEYQRAYRDYCKSVVEIDQSFEQYDFAARLAPVVQNIDPLTPSVALKEMVAKFIGEELRAGRWVTRSESQKRQYFDLLQEILGADRDATKIRPMDVQHVKNVLLKYPKNRNKKPETKNLQVSALLELQGVETLEIKTVNTYLQTYGSLFGWAKRNGYVSENVFDGVTIKESKRSSEAGRDAFSSDQLKAILHELELNERGLINKEYQKWGPLIAIYTGARLNEISQLQLDDIREQDGIWCFDFNDEGEAKKLKTTTSRRMVPVHRRLLELGLLSYTEQLRASKQPRFFHELTYNAKEGYGRNLGRWVNEKFLTALDFQGTGVSQLPAHHGHTPNASRC